MREGGREEEGKKKKEKEEEEEVWVFEESDTISKTKSEPEERRTKCPICDVAIKGNVCIDQKKKKKKSESRVIV